MLESRVPGRSRSLQSVLLVALCASTMAAADTRTPTLSQAAARASIVAYGQVERLERRAGRSIATMRVEYVARGEPAGWITFLAEPIGQYQPSANVGERILVFLESSEGDPPMKIGFNGTAVLRAFSKNGKRHVATTNHLEGLQLPERLCEPNVKFGLYGCSAKLSAVLTEAGFPSLRPRARTHGTFRVVTRQCEPCQLGPWILRSTSPSPSDCGTGTTNGASSLVIQCVRDAVASGKPFRVLLPKSGVDSEIVHAVVSDGRQVYELHFDSSIEGGGECSALVSRWPCGSLELHESEAAWLKCIDPAPRELLCSQHDARVEALTAPRDVSDLRCQASQDGTYMLCKVLPNGPRAGTVIPSGRGPSLVCYAHGDLTDLAECTPE